MASHSQGRSNGSNGGGCGAVIGGLILLGLAITYWYVSLAIVAAIAIVILVRRSQEKQRLRHRAGQWDAWLDEVNVAAADLGLTEYARDAGTLAGGAAVLGDIVLRNRTQEIAIGLLADGRHAHEAEMGMRTSPQLRDALAHGRRALVTRDRVVFLAAGRRQKVVDEFLLDEVVRVVDRIAVGPPRAGAAATRPRTAAASTLHEGDALDQLGKLGRLHAAGVLSDEEFAAKKTSLLKQV